MHSELARSYLIRGEGSPSIPDVNINHSAGGIDHWMKNLQLWPTTGTCCIFDFNKDKQHCLCPCSVAVEQFLDRRWGVQEQDRQLPAVHLTCAVLYNSCMAVSRKYKYSTHVWHSLQSWDLLGWNPHQLILVPLMAVSPSWGEKSSTKLKTP